MREERDQPNKDHFPRSSRDHHDSLGKFPEIIKMFEIELGSP